MTPSPPITITIQTQPLTPTTFSPFGTVLAPPLLPPTTKTAPNPPPPGTVSANQNTAIKSPNIAPLTSTYHTSPSGAPATPSLNLFSCFPRTLRPSSSDGRLIFDVNVLERHAFTTQTFIPIASFPSSAPTPISTAASTSTSTTATTPTSTSTSSTAPTPKIKAIIIVAPTLPSPPPPAPPPPSLTPYSQQLHQPRRRGGRPDLRGLKAFVAEVGAGVGVGYGVGVWHAPMVVVGGRVDFVVVQYGSGRGEEDCEEVDVRGVEVVVGGMEVGERERARL